MALSDHWWFCRNRNCPGQTGNIIGLGDEALVVQWLAGSCTDVFKMNELRSLLAAAHFGATELSRMSNDQVLTQAARLLISGEIHVHRMANFAESAQILPDSAKMPRTARRSGVPVSYSWRNNRGRGQ